MSLKGKEMISEYRKSERVTKGVPPVRLGCSISTNAVAKDLQPETLLSNENNKDEVISLKDRHSTSLKSKKSNSSTKRMEAELQLAEAELEAAKKIAELEMKQLERERKEDEIKKRIIEKELQLKRAQINEDISGFGNDKENDTILSVNKKEYVSDYVKNTEKWMTDKTDENNIDNNAVYDKEHDVIKALTKAVEALSAPKENMTENLRLLLSRQVGNKDLPYFSGKPEEWPAFFAEYVESTEICKLSKRENIIRLRKCLKGEAREIVEGFLINPDGAYDVIEMLKNRYGQPQHVMNSLLYKLKNTHPVKENQIETIVKLSAVVQQIVANMMRLDLEDQLTNIQTIEEVLSKLPSTWKLNWAESKYKEDKPNLKNLAEWLKNRANLINSVCSMPSQINYDKKDMTKESYKVKYKKESLLTTVSEIKYVCVFCKESNHFLQKCAEFQKLSVEERRKIVNELGLCYCCLRKGHRAFTCRTRRKCGLKGCEGFHNRILHLEDKKNFENVKKELSIQQEKEVPEDRTVIHTTVNERKILLKVLPVFITGPKRTVQTYALLDEGSTVSLIQEELADYIGVNGKFEKLRLRWMNEKGLQEIDSKKVSFDIRGRSCSEKYHLENIRTVPCLNLIPQSLNLQKLKQIWKHLELNSEHILTDYENAKPLILLGQDNWEMIISRKIIQGAKNSPAISWTNLGWVVHGRVCYPNLDSNDGSTMYIHNESDTILHKLVKESFNIENFGIVPRKSNLTKEEDRSIKIMEQTACKTNGRWEIGLPWKEDIPSLPNSFDLAYKRLTLIENKMKKNKQLQEEYCQKIREYEGKGYARKLKPEELKTNYPIWYLPHFGVVNPNKPGKFRFVFDAAAKICGISLNDKLLKGPDLMSSLVGTLFNFRQREFAFSADIKEMFHQVTIRKEDQHAQRFLWRDGDQQKNVDCYIMEAMIFGAISSPFCAQYIKNKNAEEFKNLYPRAYQAITKFHYVDDYLDSTSTEEEAKKLISEVRHIHETGGFLLRNWLSNSEEILNSIPEDCRGITKEFNQSKDIEIKSERILGMMWNVFDDMLSFSTKFHKVDSNLLECKRLPSKRELLKVVMSIYDPLGLLSNFVIKGRILIQEIWRKQLDWDDIIDKENGKKWMKWIEYLKSLKHLKIERPYCKEMKDVEEKQLHIFCDASEQAYASVAYIRCTVKEEVYVSLITAKARVMPLKELTIPKAELQGAVLGTRLASTIIKEHTITFDKIFFWVDAQTILKWLRSSNKRHPSFIANRIGEILENSNLDQWRWIPSEENVADEATRFESVLDFSNSSRWLNGPEFLKLEECKWPKEVKNHCEDSEEKENEILCHINDEKSLIEFNRFSTYEKLLRTAGWVIKFAKKNKYHEDGNIISQKILNEAESWICRSAQIEMFPTEYEHLQKGTQLTKSSKLFQYTPFIDENGLIRMTGRIANLEELNRNTTHPIILDGKHHLSRLILNFYHRKAKHYGFEIALNYVREKFWIVKARVMMKEVIKKCIFCQMRKAIPRPPVMGNLPLERLSSHIRPFTYTGIDYFGPMEVTIKRSKVKRYGVLFTCMTIRAIHIEIAQDLSTDSCINAVRRFIARRGTPKQILSDNGTNFHGAKEELLRAIQVNQDEMRSKLAMWNINWKFIPPAAPHMGGSWERLIQSVKRAISSTLTLKTISEEVLMTVLIEAENLINSRPLTRVSDNPEDLEALTPNHFLKGANFDSILGIFTSDDLILRKQWKVAQRLVEEFWKRWLKEYLPLLNKRNKWNSTNEEIKNGDYVLLMDKNIPRGKWNKGVIVKCYPGTDGHTRIVDVKTKSGVFRRPVAKLCVINLFPINEVGSEKDKSFSGGSNVIENQVVRV